MTHPTVSFPPPQMAAIKSAHLLETVTQNVDHYEFRLVPVGEVLEATEGSIVLVKDGDEVRRLVFMEDEVVQGPLIYYPLAHMDFLNWARKEGSIITVQSVLGAAALLVLGCGHFGWLISHLPLAEHPGKLLVLKVYLAVCILAALAALGNTIWVRRKLKKDAIAFIKANKKPAEQKIELPHGFQLASA